MKVNEENMNSIENNTSNNSSQQYNLKWLNHTANILQMFAMQFSKESYTDVTLACEGKYIKAHKMVLSACSPYFEEMFDTYTVPHPLVVMNGMRFNLLKILVDYMYQGEVKVKDEDLSDLLVLAEQLQVKALCKVRTKETNETKQSPENSPEEECEPSSSQNRKRRKTSHNNSDSSVSSVTSEKEPSSKDRKREPESPEENTPKDENSPNESNSQSSNSNTSAQTRTEKSAIQIPKQILAIQTDGKNTLGNASIKIIPRNVLQEHGVKLLQQDLLQDKIRRPPNAFMIFANEFRKKLATENPGESNKEISVRLGNMWKSLPHPVKAAYYSAAKRADEEHKNKYPGYYYSPKEARIRKELKSSVFRRNKSVEALQVVQLVMTDNNEDNPSQILYTETEDEDVDFINEIKEDDAENVCDSNVTFVKATATQ